MLRGILSRLQTGLDESTACHRIRSIHHSYFSPLVRRDKNVFRPSVTMTSRYSPSAGAMSTVAVKKNLRLSSAVGHLTIVDHGHAKLHLSQTALSPLLDIFHDSLLPHP